MNTKQASVFDFNKLDMGIAGKQVRMQVEPRSELLSEILAYHLDLSFYVRKINLRF
jgi:hypothetical protein